MTTMITLKEKIGYGLGDMASSMFWKLFGSYLMIFTPMCSGCRPLW